MNVPERYTIDEFPPDDIRLPMLEWLRHHGIDPNDVCVPGWIERDIEGRRVLHQAYNMAWFGRHELEYQNPDGVPMHEVRAVQLEAEPLPFPPSALRHITAQP